MRLAVALQLRTQLAAVVCGFREAVRTLRRFLSYGSVEQLFVPASSIRVQLELLYPRIVLCLDLAPASDSQQSAA
jgi:hypothetical protein